MQGAHGVYALVYIAFDGTVFGNSQMYHNICRNCQLPPALIGKNFIMLIFSCVKDCIETFTALAKFFSTKFFCMQGGNFHMYGSSYFNIVTMLHRLLWPSLRERAWV